MTETRADKAKRNIFTSVVLQMLKIALAFVSRIIFVRILGVSYLGINGLFTNILAILSIADLGMTTVMMYSLYKPLAKGDNERVAAYVRAFKKIYNGIAAIIFILGILLMPFLQYIVNLPENMDGIYLYYFLILLNVVIGYLFVYRTTLLQADQKSYIIDVVDMFAQVALFVLQIVVLIFTKNFALYLGLNVISTLVTNIIKSKIVSKKYDYLKDDAPELTKDEKKTLVRNAKDIFLYRIGGVIQTNTDSILTSIFVGTITVGYYSNYMIVISSIVTLMTLIFTSLKASFGSFNSEASIKEQEKMFYNFEDYNFLLVAFCSVCFFVLFPDFIKICFGEEYLLSIVTAVFIILNFYTSNIRQNLWVYRETTGLFSRVKYTTLVTSLINIVLSILGGYFFGITGIVAATVIARLVYAWWKEPKVIFNEYFKSSSKKYFYNYIVRLVYTCAVAYVLNIAIQFIKIDNQIVQGVVRAIVTAIFAFVLLYLPLMKNDSMKTLKNELLKGRK